MGIGKKLFTEKQISISAFLGGPIPPGILIYKNLIRLNKEKEAYVTLTATLLFTIGLIYTLILIPEDLSEKIPSQLSSTAIGLIFWGLYHFLLANFVNNEIENGTPKESNWKVAGTTLIGIVVYFGIAIFIGFTQPAFPGEKMTFNGNEIYYNESTSKEDIEKLAEQLFTYQYFSNEYQNAAHLETQFTRYVITLPISKDFWNDKDVISELNSLKLILKEEFGKEVTITLEDYELSGKRITKYL